MEFENTFLDKQDYRLGYLQENIEMVLYSFTCFFVPFLAGHPQFLVGTIVNAALVLAALNLRSYKILPIIIFPNVGVLTRGLIFGPFTVFLLYMVPFIWIGNSILVIAIKELNLKRRMNRLLSLGIGAAAKTLFLFAVAAVLVHFSVLPSVFLASMGMMQLYTALTGGLLAFGIQYAKKAMA